jgi:hypothetical protein
MKQQEVFKKIGGIIREINEQYEYLQSADEVYNELELELLAANAHFLSDHIEILRKITSHAEKAQPAAKPQVIIEDKPIAPQPVTAQFVAEDKPAAEPRYFVPEMEQEVEEEPAIETATAEEDTHTVEFEIGNRTDPHTQLPEPEEEPVAAEPEPTIRHELTLEDIGEDWDEDDEVEDIDLQTEAIKAEVIPGVIETEPILPEPEEEPVASEPETEPVALKPEVKPEPVPAPIAPAVTHTQIMVEEDQVITLNQRMSAQMAASRVSDQLHGQPISDLKSAITLNDKMLYVRELFNGYSLAYSETIDILNRAKSFEEAEAFLKGSYATKNNWADKQATADKFYALLQRRYTP